ncbi:MAG: hypothetical protein KF882_02560 [Bacteroidia bacterium]|nr:hypothetical protein [Bacteroidia bacterium]MCO5253657.1 hypothetical protein [Bacteroidota bacterium]
MKNHVKTLLLLSIVAIFTIHSCKKDSFEGEYKLTFNVTDIISKKPIKGASVGVMEISKNDFYGWGARTVGVGYTDSKGEYSISFHVSEEYRYEFLVNAPRYFESMPEDLDISVKGKSTVDAMLTPYGYLNLHIVGNKGGLSMGGGITNRRRGGAWRLSYRMRHHQNIYY